MFCPFCKHKAEVITDEEEQTENTTIKICECKKCKEVWELRQGSKIMEYYEELKEMN